MFQRNGMHLPSITALLAFESVARLKSVTAAADELCRTQSAISRQISTLEAQLGLALFDRVKQQLLLTDEGARYHQDVCRILDDLYVSTTALAPRARPGRRLSLRVGSSFCDSWLVRRLPRFAAQHPDIEVSVSVSRSLNETKIETVDLMIGMCVPNGLEMRHEPLIAERLVLVGAKGCIAAANLDVPTLQHSMRADDWRRYRALRRESTAIPSSGMSFDNFNAIIQAAIAGAGVALVPDFMVQDELDKGTLELLDPMPIETEHNYDLSFPVGRPRNRALDAFVEWIRAEAAPFAIDYRKAA